MKINFDILEKQTSQTHLNTRKDTTEYCTAFSAGKVEKGGFALDISGTVMDNSAYAGHGRTAEEVMQEAGRQDIANQHNYMAVMSNTMSDEDFARLQEEGFHPGSTEIETVVTIVDHIKTAMIKGGAEVIGYTDTVSEEKLENITGSKAFAEELEKQFKNNDIPVTEKNTENAAKGWEMLKDMKELSEGAVKYMIENGLEPTPENLYLAQHSAADGSRQGKGYYSAGEVTGYYAKKPEQIEWEQLIPQIEKVIEQSGMEVSNETLEAGRWLIEEGIPLNPDTLKDLINLKSLKLPVKIEEYLKSCASAVQDGIFPQSMNMLSGKSNYEKAVILEKQVNQIPEEAADIIRASELPLTLRNLFAATEKLKADYQNMQSAEQVPADIRGRRLLEEVRLAMTAEANLKLLRSGFQIETAPIEELVDKLKEAEMQNAIMLTNEPEGEKALQKSALYTQTLSILEDIKSAPADIAAQFTEDDSLIQIHAYGKSRTAMYEKAGEAYETVMTVPRKDMGDTIKKAFANVDDILKDLHLEPTEQNRRAVRILGYNNIDINIEKLEKVKASDNMLTQVSEAMKPGTVLQMIKEGVNPVNMPLNELLEYLNQHMDNTQEIESYSKFLYQMEQQGEISQEVRSAYIGIYRLMSQIEKTDHAAIGAVEETKAQLTLENLLTAVRSSKKKHMDYKVDSSFSGVNARESSVTSITEQIRQGILPAAEGLEKVLEEVASEDAGEEYDGMRYDEIRRAGTIEESVLKTILDYHMPVNADTLLAASEVLKKPSDLFRKIKKTADKDNDGEKPEKETGKKLEAAVSELPDALTSREDASRAYENLQQVMQNVVEEAVYDVENRAIDVKELNSLYKQITFVGNRAKEESYEIPVQIDGELTAVNLTIIRGTGENNKVTISLQTEALGKVFAEFSSVEEKLEGYVVSSNRQGTELLKSGEERLKERLTDEKLAYGQVNFITGEKQDAAVKKDAFVKLSEREASIEAPRETEQNGNQKADTKILYRTAKAFIGYIQESGIRKGI